MINENFFTTENFLLQNRKLKIETYKAISPFKVQSHVSEFVETSLYYCEVQCYLPKIGNVAHADAQRCSQLASSSSLMQKCQVVGNSTKSTFNKTEIDKLVATRIESSAKFE